MYNKPEKKKEWVTNPFPITGQIQLKKVEEFQVVYIRHTGNYTSLAKEYARLMENLFRAAAKQKLLKAKIADYITNRAKGDCRNRPWYAIMGKISMIRRIHSCQHSFLPLPAPSVD